MKHFFRREGSSEQGQILVIVGVGLLAMVAMVGLVVDGGNAWGQQRQTQNGADAMADAGATVIAESLKGAAKTGGDVGCAVEAAASLNGVTNPAAAYTDVDGNLISVDVPACGATDAIPSTAQGVKAAGDRQFDTYLARVVGVDSMTASANATAVAGLLTATCTTDDCNLLPVTFPLTVSACDGTNQQVQIGSAGYPIVSVADADASNEVIVPICNSGPGAIGWLDFGCQPNLAQTIEGPCDSSFALPSWMHTQSGNTNSLDDTINGLFAGPVLGVPDDSQVTVPINDNTCNTDPGADEPTCPGGNGSGNGDNFYYHIPKVASFMLDQVYTSGSNSPECNAAPGSPFIGGNGATGCFKGWFIQYSDQGPVGAGATGPQDPGIIGIQLIH